MGQRGAMAVITNHRGDLPRPHDLQTSGAGGLETADRSKSCRRTEHIHHDLLLPDEGREDWH